MSEKSERELFIWKKEHDICLIRELLLVEPYQHKPQSRERGQAWKDIVDNLNKLEKPKFKVAVRAVRDRFVKLTDKYKQNEREETKASGIEGIEPDEIYKGLMDIDQRMEEAKSRWAEITVKEKEKAIAQDMRKKATESLGETRKRKEAEGEIEVTPKRKRKTSEALTIVHQSMKIRQEQAERELKQKDEELKERQSARENQQQFMVNMQQQQQQFMLHLSQQNMQMMGQIAELFRSLKN